MSTQPAGLFCSVLVVPPPGWAAGASSGPKLELERHLTRLADSGVKRLVVEGSGRVGVHVNVHSGIFDDLIAGLWALRQRQGS